MRILKKQIFLVRHGTTAYNDADLLQGRIDNPLSEKGVAEASLLAKRLAGEKLQAVFCSPLQRAQQTAAVINQHHNLTLTTVADFTEIDLGQWEGMKFATVQREFDELYQRWAVDPDIAVPAGESFAAVYARVGHGLQAVLQEAAESALIVGHATVNRAILGNLLQMNPAAARLFRTANAALSKILLYENSARSWAVVDFWNDTSHLAP